MNTDVIGNNYTLMLGDCLERMKDIEDSSIDLILCDLPYGTTHNKWDTIIPFDKLWEQYNRIAKDTTPIVLFSQMPFTASLVCSNLSNFRYEWIFEKTSATGFLNANRMPLKCHENIEVFYRKLPIYNPQKTEGHTPTHAYTHHNTQSLNYGDFKDWSGGGNTDRFPRDVIKFKKDTQKSKLHPTQKPVEMLEYIINTYTDKGMTVLDNCMGSGSTGVACLHTGRKFIGIEMNEEYFDICVSRLKEEENRNKFTFGVRKKGEK